MAEFDDERIASLKQRRKTAMLDRFLTFAGLALAGASAFFPWYVFFNEDKFGINVATSGNSRELPDWPALVHDGVAGFSWPLAWGLESGHVAPNRTLPLGLPARLEGGRLVLGEG